MDDLSPEMQAFQEEFRDGLLGEAGFMYPDRLTPTPGAPFWGSVWAADPKGKQYTELVNQVSSLGAFETRFLTVRPSDSEPAIGARMPYQGGELILGVWTDHDALSGERIGVCRMVDARAYPITAEWQGQAIRLRIRALNGAAGSTSDLTERANDSHRGMFPPGLFIPAGDTITTSSGDVYLVVPPIQRDSLGDTLGLSWRGPQGGRDPTDANDPTPITPPGTLPPVPGWWNEVDP